MARIDDIKGDMQALRNADVTTTSEAARIIESAPAVTWLTYGVHGDEISSTDAAMLTAYHLLAARGDQRVDSILSNSVVVLDPMQNPDGRDRFIHGFEIAEGLVPSPHRISAEHDQPWPSGRHNHYLFDLNRDWFAMTQPETIGKVAVMQEWYPVVVADLHEMGGDRTYFFRAWQPIRLTRTSPPLSCRTRNSTAEPTLAGSTSIGIDYFTRDVYDEFYTGYASWTYFFRRDRHDLRTGRRRGTRATPVRRRRTLLYAESVRNHFVTSLATAETTASNRQLLLQRLHDFQISAIDEGRSDDIRAYIIPTQADQAGANELAGKLVLQGVKVGIADEKFFRLRR